MSAISGLGAPSAAGLPPVDQTLLPAAVRNGPPAAKSAYETALGFESMLVNQLAQEMMATAGGSAQTGSSDGSGGSDPMSGGYSTLVGQALTSSIMADGGLGIAQQIATALDPALGAAAPGAGAPGAGALTPGAGALTPGAGALTPGAGALAPGAGALTPPAGGAGTPVSGGVAPAGSAAPTPASKGAGL
jgi:hypothetical protein